MQFPQAFSCHQMMLIVQVAARTIQQQSDLESMAIAFNNMAMLLQKMGRISEAEQLLSDALTAREDLWGADSAALAVFLDSTGVYFANTGATEARVSI